MNGLTEAVDIEYQFTSIWLRQMMESLQEGGRSTHSYLHHLEDNLLSLTASDDMTLERYFDFGNFMKVRLIPCFVNIS